MQKVGILMLHCIKWWGLSHVCQACKVENRENAHHAMPEWGTATRHAGKCHQYGQVGSSMPARPPEGQPMTEDNQRERRGRSRTV